MEPADVVLHSDDPGNSVVAVSGEIDLAVGDDLLSTLQAVIRARGAAAVTVDLSSVSFMDSTGVHVLLKALATAQASGVGFTVVGATGIARRVLEMTGVLGALSGGTDTDSATRVPPMSSVTPSQAAGSPLVGMPG